MRLILTFDQVSGPVLALVGAGGGLVGSTTARTEERISRILGARPCSGPPCCLPGWGGPRPCHGRRRRRRQAEVDVDAHLPLLSTFLGHVSPRETYWYLTGVPELLELAVDRMDSAPAGVRR